MKNLIEALKHGTEHTEPSGAAMYRRDTNDVEYTCALGAIHWSLFNRGVTNVALESRMESCLTELKKVFPALQERIQLNEVQQERWNLNEHPIPVHALIMHLNDSESMDRSDIINVLEVVQEQHDLDFEPALALA